MDIVVWLQRLGRGKYEAIFRENEIDETVLPDLTAEDLRELGEPRWATAASCSTRRCAASGWQIAYRSCHGPPFERRRRVAVDVIDGAVRLPGK
jgi:hypothetical protein